MNIMKNSKLLIVLLSVLLVSLSGCSEPKLRKVKCDSGFETLWYQDAYIDDGIILWKSGYPDPYTERKMMPGEVCEVLIKRVK